MRMGRPRTPSQHDESTVLWGYLLVFFSSAYFILMMCVYRYLCVVVTEQYHSGAFVSFLLSCRFNIVGAKFLLPTGNPLLDFIATDWYYRESWRDPC